jgi:hypothetical protein
MHRLQGKKLMQIFPISVGNRTCMLCHTRRLKRQNINS